MEGTPAPPYASAGGETPPAEGSDQCTVVPPAHTDPAPSPAKRRGHSCPAPLPPEPPILLDAALQRSLEAATLALGRLDAVSSVLPDPAIFLYTYIRKEAVLSSQIEGTQSSLSDLLMFERKEAPGVPLHDAVEVSNHVAALERGLQLMQDGLPPCIRLLREVHAVLLSQSRDSGKTPGDFRRSQNRIGGTRPGNAAFVPPPPTEVPDCMAALERFLNEREFPALIRAALAHVQFETIHPFLDGNGRVGRLLIALLLHDAGALRQPLLYLSLYFKQHRTEYYRQLNEVRLTGDWESWLAFFLEGVEETATGAVNTCHRLDELLAADKGAPRRSGSARQLPVASPRRIELAGDRLPHRRAQDDRHVAANRRQRHADPG